MSRDSVAVIVAEMQLFANHYGSPPPLERGASVEIAMWAERLDRLTREAAPQASNAEAWCQAFERDVATFGQHYLVDRLLKAVEIIRRLATTDSAQAIQSQQGATGGAVLRELIAASKEVYRISERDHIAWHRLSAALEAAHPQAAGSAPGEAREVVSEGPFGTFYVCDRCRGAGVNDSRSAAGSAPVGVG